MIEGSGSESIPLTSGSGSGRPEHVDPVDPDPEHCFAALREFLSTRRGNDLTALDLVLTAAAGSVPAAMPHTRIRFTISMGKSSCSPTDTNLLIIHIKNILALTINAAFHSTVLFKFTFKTKKYGC